MFRPGAIVRVVCSDPERREVTTALQRQKHEECHGPKYNNDDGNDCEDAECGSVARGAEDATVKEQGTDLDEAQRRCGEHVDRNIQLEQV